MPKFKAPKRKFNDSKSRSKVNKQYTPIASKTTTNTQSINKSTTTFLTLPRELRQQILYQTFTTHIEYEISWYDSLSHLRHYSANESFSTIEIWAENLRLAYPVLVDDIEFVQGQAIGSVRQAVKGIRTQYV